MKKQMSKRSRSRGSQRSTSAIRKPKGKKAVKKYYVGGYQA